MTRQRKVISTKVAITLGKLICCFSLARAYFSGYTPQTHRECPHNEEKEVDRGERQTGGVDNRVCEKVPQAGL